jgi:hypothetical protein
MRHQSLILGIVLVVLVLAFYVYNCSFESEGFETWSNSVQDRTNPLAGQQNPLKNPAVPIGISKSKANALRNMTAVALNQPTATADGAGSYKQVMPIIEKFVVTPRIDDETSYLGMIQMCKEKGKAANPFSDSQFNENCGMCITSGTLKTGESFTGPTGVLVYKKDKEEAISTAVDNGYPFARALPSVDSAICVGANKDNESLPVLAINQKDYDAFRKRKACRDSHQIGQQCGRCVSDQESTWIPPSGGKQPLTLYLWGSGKAKVSLANGFTSDFLSLSDSASAVPIGRVEEGTDIQISVQSDGGPYVYGAIVSATAAQGVYKLPIEKFMEVDTISGAAPRRNGVKYFDGVKVFCTKLMGQSGRTSMNLKGFIPITLVEVDQLAAFDCPSGPLVQSQGSAELLIDDVCLNPRGQGPGTYSDDCVKQTILQAGCSTNGTWYKNPPADRNFNIANYLNMIKEKAKYVESDPEIAMGCKGIDIRTPCDAFLNGGIPDKACMTYLYLNQSEKSKRVGRAYKNADTKFASVIGNTIGFCRPEGSLNPEASPNAMGELTEKAGGYKGLSGIEAVKAYLSDVFMKAVGSLDVNIEDDKGGRRTSWKKCFNMKIADPPLAGVVKNSINDVIDNRTNCFPFPKNIDLPREHGKLLGQVALTQDYTLSFNIIPRAINGNWNNIIHFTTNNADWHAVGCRTPAIWFFPGSLNLHVRIGDTRDWNWGIDTDPIPINQKSSFRLDCKGNQVTVTVNDRVYRATQPTQRASGNAVVYAPNPFYVSANAYIENLCYVGGGSPAHVTPNYSCVTGWDHGGADIACWGSGQTIQNLENMCNNDPNCQSYNTFWQSGGCIKNRQSRNITNPNGAVTNFCVKRTS